MYYYFIIIYKNTGMHYNKTSLTIRQQKYYSNALYNFYKIQYNFVFEYEFRTKWIAKYNKT